jgi:uncharacterized protein (DUF2147 family)
MKINSLFILFLFPALMLGQSVLGEWKTINDETGKARSIVEIYEAEDGMLYGKVKRILNEEKRENLCVECKGKNKNKKIEGLILMEHFKKEDKEYVDGSIVNPNNGKVYDSKMWIDPDEPDILNIRGYIGFFYKTVQWQRN